MNVIDTIRNSDIKEKCGYRSGLLKRLNQSIHSTVVLRDGEGDGGNS